MKCVYSEKYYINIFLCHTLFFVKKKGMPKYASRRAELEEEEETHLLRISSEHGRSNTDHDHSNRAWAIPKNRRRFESNGHSFPSGYGHDRHWREYAHDQDHPRSTYTSWGHGGQHYKEPWVYPGPDVSHSCTLDTQTKEAEGQWGWDNAKLVFWVILILVFLAAFVRWILEHYHMPSGVLEVSLGWW